MSDKTLCCHSAALYSLLYRYSVVYNTRMDIFLFLYTYIATVAIPLSVHIAMLSVLMFLNGVMAGSVISSKFYSVIMCIMNQHDSKDSVLKCHNLCLQYM